MPIKKHKKKRIKSTRAVTNKARPNKKLAKKSAHRKKTVAEKNRALKKNKLRGKTQDVETVVLEPKELETGSVSQSGDLQGLSNMAETNSESVEELLEEGNSFEAEAVKGVEDATDADEVEVRTHQVPDDVS